MAGLAARNVLPTRFGRAAALAEGRLWSATGYAAGWPLRPFEGPIGRALHERFDGGRYAKTMQATADWLRLKACFAAGTKLMARGEWGEGYRCIEEITTADEVLSRSEFDPQGPLEWKRVEETFTRFAEVVNLHVGGQIVRTTAEHPFWAVNRGEWVAAQDLAIGDALVGHDGAEVLVEGVAPSGLWLPVYNLRVADYHTYFVGCDEWGFSVWAHNAYWEETVHANFAEFAKRNTKMTDSHIDAAVRAFESGGEAGLQTFLRGLKQDHPLGLTSNHIRGMLNRANSAEAAVLRVDPATLPAGVDPAKFAQLGVRIEKAPGVVEFQRIGDANTFIWGKFDPATKTLLVENMHATVRKSGWGTALMHRMLSEFPDARIVTGRPVKDNLSALLTTRDVAQTPAGKTLGRFGFTNQRLDGNPAGPPSLLRLVFERP